MDSLSTRLTPYVALPRQVPSTAGSRPRERALCFALFSLIPSALYWSWYLGPGNNAIPADFRSLEFAAPLSGIMITIAPLVFQHGEFIYEDLLHSVFNDDASAGWDIPAVQRTIDGIDRLYHWFTMPATMIAGGAVGYVMYTIRDIAPISSPISVAGEIVVLLFLGHVTATGVWGGTKVMLVVHRLATTADPRWKPFRAPSQGFLDLFRFAWADGVSFSISNCTVPALLVVWPRLGAAPKAVCVVFILLTSVGGLLMFGLTTWWLNRLAQRMHERAVDDLAPHLEELSDDLTVRRATLSAADATRSKEAFEALLALRQHLVSEHPAPRIRTLVRASTTVLLPVFLLLLQHLLG